jgi:predicted metal-binding membrane protein
MPDRALIALGKKELEILGLAQGSEISGGAVVRMPKAYPIYESNCDESLQILRQFFGRIENLQVVGRNGMHKYNNQDHSMLTSMLAVENILGANHDLWQVNTDQEYSEEINRKPLEDPVTLSAIKRAFARMDKLAFAAALGSVCGLGMFFATVWLVIKGGEVIGPNIQLLDQYFIGYTVSIKGAFIGMGFSFFWGFLFGWLFAYLRNLGLALFLYRVKRKTELLSLRVFFDHF